MIVEQMFKNAQTPLLHIADVSGSALFQGDCLDIMPLMPDKSVQLILADLPYGTTACKWDSIIDLDLLWKQYIRIIKDNGAIVLTATQPFTTKLINSNFDMFKYDLVWVKSSISSPMLANKRPLPKHESVLIFYRNHHIYNPQKTFNENNRVRKIKAGKMIASRGESIYGDLFRTEMQYDKTRFPTSVMEYSNPPRNNQFTKKHSLHPTQKPLELMKYLISTYSNEEDMVLDNTMGSGTTCLAAKELNRKFIGIEKEANYYEIACRRCGF